MPSASDEEATKHPARTCSGIAVVRTMSSL